MKRKILDWLITFLGGHTEEEFQENSHNSYNIGALTMLYNLKIYADRINGTPADDWCKRMYRYVTDSINRMEHSK